MQPEQNLPASYRLCVLLHGPLSVFKRVSDKNWKPVAWGQSRLARSVFRRLLAAPGRHLSRGQLADDLWPENDFEAADTSLQTTISLLRSAIGKDLITTWDGGYEVAGQALVWVDLDAAETLLKVAENQGYTTLAALPNLEEALFYLERGAYLEEETGVWCHQFRKKSEDLQRSCRLWLAESYEEQGKLLQAGLQYRALLQLMPPNEYALQRWITMLHRQGETAEALKCYQDAKSMIEAQGFTLSLSTEQVVISLEKQPTRHLFSEESGILQPSFNQSPIITTTRITEMNYTINNRLDQAESVINLAWESWFVSKPSQATREITRLLPTLERVILLPLATIHILRAKELATRCHGLLGAIYIDALQNDAALYHHVQAHTLAEEIRDVNLAVTYLALIGDVLRRQNDKATAVSYMEHARDQAAKADQATLGHVLQLLAYTYGDIGNEAAFEQTISEATDLLAFTGEGRDSAGKEFIPFEIYEIQGKANRDLGKPLKAIPYLELAEKSLSQAESVTPRWHALLEISRGQAFCDAGDIAIGIDLAIKGFTEAYQCRSPRQMNRVRKLLRKLENSQWRADRKVNDLRELIHENYLRMDLEK
ncbi:MAG: winged helix-turn-helix domain-containing protein [Ktedonobacteraceae bacterium]